MCLYLFKIPKTTNRNTLWPKTKPGKEMPLNTNQLKQILEKMGLEEGYKILTEREKQIICSYYLEGYKDEEIAVFYGVTQQVINRLRRKGSAKLKKR